MLLIMMTVLSSSALLAFSGAFRRKRLPFTSWIFTAGLFLFIASTSLNAQVSTDSWIGATVPGGDSNSFLQHNIKDAYVTANGAVLGATWYEESHREIALYRSPSITKRNTTDSMHANGHNPLTIVADGTYIYVPTEKGLRRYTEASSGLNFVSNHASLVSTAATPRIFGIAQDATQLYLADHYGNQIRVVRKSDMTLVRDMAFSSPRKMAMTPGGNLWVIQQGSSSNNRTHDPGAGATIRRIDPETGIVLNTISDVLLPTAIGLHHQTGQLMVGDSDPSRNHVRIYHPSTGALVSTFGSSFSSTANGDIPGEVKPGKFDFLVGVGADSSGKIHVVSNGGPPWNGVSRTDDYDSSGRSPGNAKGTHIQVIDPASPDSWVWEMHNSHYINNADVDPADETLAYTMERMFRIDYSKPRGQQSKLIGYTIDRERFPNDYRLVKNHTYLVNTFRAAGQLFLLVSDQYKDTWVIYRMDGFTAVQCAMIITVSPAGTFPPNNLGSGRQLWVDGANGNPVDGDFQAGEYASVPILGFPAGVCADKNGTLWFANGGNIVSLPLTRVTVQGVPQYEVSNLTYYPRPEGITTVRRLDYDADRDVMVVASIDNGVPGGQVMRVDDFTTKPTSRPPITLDTAPIASNAYVSISLTGDYVFVGRRLENQVYVFDTLTGEFKLSITPSNSVGGPWPGTGLDVPQAVNSFRRSNGEYVVFTEDVSWAKVLMHRLRLDAPVAAPVGFAATPGNLLVNLQWNTQSLISGFNLYRSTQAGNPGDTPYMAGLTETTWTDRDVTNGTTYYYQLAPVANGMEGPRSPVISAQPQSSLNALAIRFTSPANGKIYSANVGTLTLKISISGGSGTVQQVLFRRYQDRTLRSSNTQTASPFEGEFRNVNSTSDTYMAIVTDSSGQRATAELYAAWGTNRPLVPIRLSAGPDGGGVRVTWAPVGGAMSYRIYRSTIVGDANPTLVASDVNVPTWRDANAAAGSRYYYTVSAVNANGESTRSAEINSSSTDGHVPQAPTGLIASVDVRFVGLAWNASPGALSYSLFLDGSLTPYATDITSRYYHDDGLPPGTARKYRVAAVGLGGAGEKSAEVSTRTLPERPLNLTTQSGNGQATLTWLPALGAAQYRIYSAANTTDLAVAPVLATSTTPSFTATGLTNGTLRYFQVEALNEDGVAGVRSVSVSARPFPPGVAPVVTITSPANNAVYSGNSVGTLTVNASIAVGDSPLSKVEFLDNGAVKSTQTTPPWSHDFRNLGTGAYDLGVRAFDTAGRVVTQTVRISVGGAVPAAPSPQVYVGENFATLFWNSVSGSQKYTVYRYANSGQPDSMILADNLTTPTFTDNNLQTGTSYYYTVTASNMNGTSAQSWQIVATPGALMPIRVAPSITTQPTPATVHEGGYATLSAVSDGSPAPSLRWQRDLSGTWTDVSGATSATLSFASATSANAGAYRMVATNSEGSAISNVATLIVHPNSGLPGATAAAIGSGSVFVSRVLGNGLWEQATDAKGINGDSNGADSLLFDFVQQSGDFQAVVNIRSLSGPASACAGLMLRETNGAGVRYVAIASRADQNYIHRVRTAAGQAGDPESVAQSSGSNISHAFPNKWVLIKREGDLITVGISNDGQAYTQVESYTLGGLSSQVQIGIFTIHGSSGDYAIASFADFSVEPIGATRIFSGSYNDGDSWLRSTGTDPAGGAIVQSATDPEGQIGFGGSPARFNSTVLVFQLPLLPAGESFATVDLRFSAAIIGSPTFNADLYGLPRRTSATVMTTDFFAGSSDVSATLIQNNLLRSTSGLTGALMAGRTTNDEGMINLRSYLNAQYDGGAGAGQFVFLRFSMDTGTYASSTERYTIGMADHSDSTMRPFIEYTSAENPPPDVPDPRWMGHTILSEDGCGRATADEETNKIVSFGDKTHVSWLDSVAEGFRVRVRTLDRTTGEWSPTYTVGEAYDNHGGPTIAVDSEGYLHIAYGPHGPINAPMRYRRSLLPNDASQWTAEEQFALASTYPTMVVAADDTLILTCRQSHSFKPWTVDLYTRPKNGNWSAPREVLRAEVNGHSHFQKALSWSPNHSRLHMTYRQSHGEAPRDSFYVGYLYSDDMGQTWRQADGTNVPLPARYTETTEIATDDPPDTTPGNIHCGSLAVAPDGTPYAILIRIDPDTTASHVDLAWLNHITKTWEKRSLLPFIHRMSDGTSGHIRVGGFSINTDAEMFLTLNTGERTSTGAISDGDPSSEVFLLRSTDNGMTFSSTQISPSDSNTPHWHSTVEKDTGWNPLVGEPACIYTAGTRGVSDTSIVSNDVYYVDFKQLPLADANGNGLANLVEVAFGMGGNFPASGTLPEVEITADAIRFIYEEPAGIRNVIYGADWSENLREWFPATDTGSGKAHDFSVPLANREQLFLRHRISIPR